MSALSKLDPGVVLDNLPAMFAGAGVTLGVALASIAAGLVIGMGVCLCRISGHPVLRGAARVYISVLRGVPILVLLLLVFYMLPLVGLEAPPLLAAIAALSLNSGAFQAEIYRGGFASIAPGQAEAARALGLGEGRILGRIMVPQVLWLVLPALVGELIVLLKNTSLISVIAVTELMRASQQLVSKTYRPTEIYLAAALFYIVMNLALAGLGTWVRRRLAGGREVTP